ncbi:MAG: hypothetical protein CMK09_16560 [Ponticaulis sp.]|nr:hypothetical protein [Ponticaulis sp.]|tara:strand:- start:552 stop:1712 length:1161 start_codon:yes stop_codon:yes gene_type:complete
MLRTRLTNILTPAILTTGLMVSACSPQTAQEPAPAANETSAASDQQTLRDEVSAIIHEVPVETVPGIIVVIDKPGKRIALARGVANTETGLPMPTDAPMRLGSICKTYMAALAVILSNEGVVDLEAPISTYLGEDVLSRIPEGLDPTIRQLMNHTSGIPDYYNAQFYATYDPNTPLTPELALSLIKGESATGTPGEDHAYSNTNYHLLALILEKETGEALGALLQSRIFEPLGLDDTSYNVLHPPGDVIHGYGEDFDGWEDMFESRENTGPDGGIMATPDDLITFYRALFAPDGALADVGEVMTADPFVSRERRYEGLGVGTMENRAGAQVEGHTGGITGYFSAAYYRADTDTVMVMHMNQSDEEAFGATFSAIARLLLTEPAIVE